MATLFELKEEILKGRKVKRKDWKNDEYQFLGFYEAYPGDIFADDWELEPLPKAKKKITMYQFVYKHKQHETFFITGELYKNEENFKIKMKDILIIDNITIVKTIPYEIEIEE